MTRLKVKRHISTERELNYNGTFRINSVKIELVSFLLFYNTYCLFYFSYMV